MIDRRRLELCYANRLAAATYPLYTSLLSSPAVPAAHRPTRRQARGLIHKVRRVAKAVPSASHPLEHLAMIQNVYADMSPSDPYEAMAQALLAEDKGRGR